MTPGPGANARRVPVGAVITFGCVLVTLLAASRTSRVGQDVAPARTATRSAYSGILTFATTGNGDPFHPTVVQDLDLASSALTPRFNGLDASRARSGETAFLQRLGAGLYADHAVVVADARGVPGRPLFVCQSFESSTNRVCAAPKVSPDGRAVAFTAVGGGGSVCKGQYDMYWAAYVVVRDRRGAELARFEGYHDAEWLPDGRLLMLGSACRGAGVWVADTTLRALSRVDGELVATPAAATAVRPDGRRVAFVWNNQLWGLSLGATPELEQLTQLDKPVTAAAWSPDGRAIAALMFDVSMPVRAIALFRPDDARSLEIRTVAAYPYGPLSWQ
jgi:hypothetical protein